MPHCAALRSLTLFIKPNVGLSPTLCFCRHHHRLFILSICASENIQCVTLLHCLLLTTCLPIDVQSIPSGPSQLCFHESPKKFLCTSLLPKAVAIPPLHNSPSAWPCLLFRAAHVPGHQNCIAGSMSHLFFRPQFSLNKLVWREELSINLSFNLFFNLHCLSCSLDLILLLPVPFSPHHPVTCVLIPTIHSLSLIHSSSNILLIVHSLTNLHFFSSLFILFKLSSGLPFSHSSFSGTIWGALNWLRDSPLGTEFPFWVSSLATNYETTQMGHQLTFIFTYIVIYITKYSALKKWSCTAVVWSLLVNELHVTAFCQWKGISLNLQKIPKPCIW